MDTNKSLYFIAIVPPVAIYHQILDWKNYFAENHQSKGALNSPPHITLHMPFRWPDKREIEVDHFLHSICHNQDNFSIRLKSFKAFVPRVIYIDVEESSELRVLQKKIAAQARKVLGVFNDDYKNRGFTPHITVAFRDLKKPEFFKAWEKIKNEVFEAEFKAKDLCLLKHNGNHWEVIRTFYFNN